MGWHWMPYDIETVTTLNLWKSYHESNNRDKEVTSILFNFLFLWILHDKLFLNVHV